MFLSYFRTAFRTFLKYKSYTALNIVGLTLGMVASLLILQYVKYERSFDRFHTKADDIYRVQYNQYHAGNLRFKCAAAVPAVGPALKNNFPEVLRFTRLYPVSGVITYESPEKGLISFREQKVHITDTSVFTVFDFNMLNGNPETALKGPNKAAISSKMAQKYFGDADPMGKTIRFDGNNRLEVTGIFEDLPLNSHIQMDFLFSYQTLSDDAGPNAESSWGWYDFNTYVLLQPGTDPKVLQAKWDDFVFKTRNEEWAKRNVKQEFILQPLTDIHLGEKLLQESEPSQQGDRDSVYALSFIALFILVIAWVNYINLATARSFDRANEVGVRKVMGAFRSQLLYQFFAESLLVNGVAVIISLITVRLLWPVFADLSGRAIPLEFMTDPAFWLLTFGLFIGGSLLSGFYPAIVLSSFQPVSVLKGKMMRSPRGGLVRKSLVVFQFVASVTLITGSVVVYQQLGYMRSRDLGVDIRKTLVFRGPGIRDSLYGQRKEDFKAEVRQMAGIKAAASSSNVPGDEIFWASGIKKLADGPEGMISGYTVAIDNEYVKTFDLKVIAGRDFDKAHPNEGKSMILNRAMVQALGFKDPESAIGQKVVQGDTLEIVGVLENYHQMSLKETITPLVYRFNQGSSFYCFKVESNNYSEVLSALEEKWKTFFPGNPVEYFYLDEFFNRQYDGDRQFGQIFGIFTILAVFIACMGLFGLASFMTMQRTKEIGIRKVLGSTAPNIVLLLSRGFIQLVLIANLIAWPLAWWTMTRWLEGFPYHVSINPVIFIAAGAGVVLIAFLSVSTQTMKAALLNPAETLKYE